MYLTRNALDTRRRETLRALGSVNMIHGAIESAFPGERRRRLWRIDVIGGVTWLMLLSETEPDLSRLQAQFGYTDRPWETKCFDRLLERIREGTIWRFRLVANPTRSEPSGKDGERGKVVAEGSVPAQREWLMRHAAVHGFSLNPDCFDVVRSEWKLFRKGRENGRPISVLQVTYEGTMEVTDAERFREALLCGIGRAKAYGMGMMTVIRHE